MESNGNPVPEDIKAAKGKIIKNFFPMLCDFCDNGWISIVHGDPRLDNWFFNEAGGKSSIGILDWQLMLKSNVATDLSWAFSTCIPDAFANEHETELLQAYWAKLTTTKSLR